MSRLDDALDAAIGVFSPRAAYERKAWRAAAGELAEAGKRGYGAATRGRRTADWRASAGSGDAEVLTDLALLRARSRQMVRDNGYVAAALRNLTANIVGTGIELRTVHPDRAVAGRAKRLFDEWARQPVDVEGRHDFYGAQALAVRSMIEGGETLVSWRAAARQPDARIALMEGDHIDSSHTKPLADGGRVVGGVEFDAEGRRVAYHLFEHHPGEQIAWLGVKTRRVEARDYDHMFEAMRISGQARGVPWFHAGLQDVREVAGVEESLRVKRRIEASLTVFRKAAETSTPSPLAQRTEQAEGPAWERISPGMVINGKPGESLDIVNPSSSGDGDGFMRAQLMKIAASFGLPYHLMTGDVSQANYSSLRAAMVAFWALLDGWVYNTVAPQLCTPAFRRRMAVEALARKDSALLEVQPFWTPPKRAWVDPLKDIAAEVMEVRAFGGFSEAYAARGKGLDEGLQQWASETDRLKALGIASDADASRVNGSGGLQPAVGYLAPSGSAA